MLTKRLIAMVCGTAACALALGNYMQSTAPQRTASAAQTAPAAPVDLQSITLTSAAPAAPPAADRPAAPVLAKPAVPAQAAASACPVTAVAVPAPLASAKTVLSAPCYPHARVAVHHSGLMFTAVTDDSGTLMLTVPVLSEQAVFVFELPDGRGAVAAAEVPGLGQADRVALQWTGKAGFEIHALEDGASYGQAGHIWSGGGSASASHVARFGDPAQPAARMAEIFTFDRSSGADLAVVLSVEAEVTAQNCGRDVSAQALELRAAAPLRSRDLTLTMPDCSAEGDFLVLNNLVQDLTIAAR